MRSRKRFFVFTILYVALIIWMSYSLQTAEGVALGIAIISSVLSSILYAWLVIRFRRMEIATLKCVGYTNNDIRTVILGEIIWVSISSFIVVFELLIHFTAFEIIGRELLAVNLNGYEVFISPLNLIITIGIFLLAQVAGILLAYRKILKLRPIVALRIMK